MHSLAATLPASTLPLSPRAAAGHELPAHLPALAAAAPLGGGLTLPGPLVNPEWLAGALGNGRLRLLDVRPADAFAEAHIPGAVRVELPALATRLGGVDGMLLPAPAFARQVGALGVGSQSLVVVYDDQWGMAAARVFWALRRYGHTQVALLTGGWDQWLAERRPMRGGAGVATPAFFGPRFADETVADRAWVERKLDQRRSGESDLLLVDTRGSKEYAEGHLPGAVNWDWVSAIPADGWNAVKGLEEVRSSLLAAGITPEREIVTYCRSGVRAAHTWWVLQLLGYPRVRLYDGSWLEWSQAEGVTIETGPQAVAASAPALPRGAQSGRVG